MTAIVAPGRLPLSRRRVLLGLALGTAAFGAGCGEQARAQALSSDAPPDDDPNVDVPALVAQFVMERVASYAYAQAKDGVGADLRPVFEAFGAHHAAHVAAVQQALEALAVELPPWEAPTFPTLDDELAVLRYALLLESQAAHVYLTAIGQFLRREHVVRAADILGSEVAHVIVLRQGLADELAPGLAQAQDVAFLRDLAVPGNNR
jgi:hypothetical protein